MISKLKSGLKKINLKILLFLIIIVEVLIFFNQQKVEVFPSKEVFFSKSEDEQFLIIEKSSQADPVRAWEYLKSLYIKDGQVLSTDDSFFDLSHMFGHSVAQEMYRAYGTKSISYCDPTFSYSCYHGASQYALIQKGMSGIKDLMQGCIKGEDISNEISCAHGIGHGFLTYEKLDIPKALTDCEQAFSDKIPTFRSACDDGVFMEYIFVAPKNSITKESIWNFCSSFSEPYHKLTCSFYAINFLQDKQDFPISESIPLCSAAPTQELVDSCQEGIHLGIAHTAKGNKNTIENLCSAYQSDAQKNECMFKATMESMYQRYYKWNENLQELCSVLSPTSEKYKKICESLNLK